MARRPPLTALLCALLVAAAGCGRMGDPIPPGQALLAPPGNLNVLGRDDAVLLRWSPPSTTVGGKKAQPVGGYLVERSEWPPGAEACETCPATSREIGRIDAEARRALNESPEAWTDADVREGWTYRYRVYPEDSRGRVGTASLFASIPWIRVPVPQVSAEPVHRGARIRYVAPPLPAAPPGLTAQGLAVYDRRGRLVLQLPSNADEGGIEGLENDVPVEFFSRWVLKTAEGRTLESAPVATLVTPRDLTPPEPPSELVAIGEIGGVSLHWLPARGESYAELILERTPSPTNGDTGEPVWQEIARLPGGTVSYRDSVTPGARYRYRAIAVDAAGNRSVPSTVSEARSLRELP